MKEWKADNRLNFRKEIRLYFMKITKIRWRNFIYIIFIFLIFGCMPDDEKTKNNEAKPVNKQVAVESSKNINNLSDALSSGLPVVAKIGSDRCYPCRMMNPVMEELSKEVREVIFLNIDVYANRLLAGAYKVRVIPTILFFNRRAELVEKVEGALSKEQVLEKLKIIEIIEEKK